MEQWIEYEDKGVRLKGFLAWDENKQIACPGVLIAHAWRGQDDFARQKARALASLGYVGFAIDMYGDAKDVKTNEEASALMTPFFLDREYLRGRVLAAFSCFQNQKNVPVNQIGAIGYCFGGLCALEILRSGVDVKGVVSFHGSFGRGSKEVPLKKITPIVPQPKGSFLMLHGAQDPFTSKEDVEATLEELSKVNADWQLNLYSDAMHAFTVPGTNDPAKGMLYNEKAEKRAWTAMQSFFQETFGR